MSVEISADTAVVMKVKGQYLAVSKTAKRFPRSQTRSPGFVLSQLVVLRTTRYSHLRSLRSGAATRLIIPMERDTFQDPLPSYLMSFRQILETVAISKYSVGKLMPIY